MRSSLLAVAATVVGGCAPVTQLLVEVRPAPELPPIEAVVVEVLEQDGDRSDGPTAFWVAGTDWTRSFAIVPRDGDATRRIRVEITACETSPEPGGACPAGLVRARQVFRAGFVSAQKIAVSILLAPVCSTVECAENDVCVPMGPDAHVCEAIAGLSNDGGARDASVSDASIDAGDASARDAALQSMCEARPLDGGTACPGEMVFIPAGIFLMGAASSDALADEDERPVHAVAVNAFCIDRTEVTVAAYRACSGCSAAATNLTYCNGGVSGRDTHPINCVTWQQASAFCRARGARLPTEAEWEYAARGTDERLYPWGDERPTCDRLNFWLCHSGEPSTAPVGTYLTGRSPFGLDDMAGNVWELVSDVYDAGYYATSEACGPSPTGPSTGLGRVSRGGGFDSGDFELRVTNRSAGSETRYGHFIGFRCAADAL